MNKNIRYQVVTADSYRVIADGFYSWKSACAWAERHDYGQFEDEGGLCIIPYEKV